MATAGAAGQSLTPIAIFPVNALTCLEIVNRLRQNGRRARVAESGRRTGLRIQRVDPWGFESPLSHTIGRVG